MKDVATVTIIVPPGIQTPPVGTSVSVPVDGGQGWLTLGVIDQALLLDDAGTSLRLRLDPAAG